VEVDVIRSAKRRKTAQARLVAGRLEVRIPARSSKAEEQRLVEVFRRRYEKAGSSTSLDLTARAKALAKRFDLPVPTEIRWVTNQAHRWGSCTPSTGVVRISDRMASFPPWVVDHVIVHELAHLVERNHGPAFQALAGRYPLAERAEGYLLAKSDGDAPDGDALAGDEPDAEPDAEPGDGPEEEPDLPGDGRLFS
jgi:predicted metal-dependent hydrolase